ncbi:hypothetical protein GCM10023115_44490 [Pontixanthobacter gangjinensis]
MEFKDNLKLASITPIKFYNYVNKKKVCERLLKNVYLKAHCGQFYDEIFSRPVTISYEFGVYTCDAEIIEYLETNQ